MIDREVHPDISLLTSLRMLLSDPCLSQYAKEWEAAQYKMRNEMSVGAGVRDGKLIKDSRLAFGDSGLSNDRRRELGLGVPPVNLAFGITAPRHGGGSRSRTPPRIHKQAGLDTMEDYDFMRLNPSAEVGALKIRLRRYEEEGAAAQRLLDEEREKNKNLERMVKELKSMYDTDADRANQTGEALRIHQETNSVLADDLNQQLRRYSELQEEQKALILASAQECAQHDATSAAKEQVEKRFEASVKQSRDLEDALAQCQKALRTEFKPNPNPDLNSNPNPDLDPNPTRTPTPNPNSLSLPPNPNSNCRLYSLNRWHA